MVTLEEAIGIIKKKPTTAWMAWGVLKWNEGYIICDSQYIKKYPDDDYLFILKGECFPKSPLYSK